jgi:hypothetical protein
LAIFTAIQFWFFSRGDNLSECRERIGGNAV